MLESILFELPQLSDLEEAIASLEQGEQAQQAKVQALQANVAEGREADLTASAKALNAGRSAPESAPSSRTVRICTGDPGPRRATFAARQRGAQRVPPGEPREDRCRAGAGGPRRAGGYGI